MKSLVVACLLVGAAHASQAVWVNFGGATLTRVSPGQDDAPNGKSELAGTQFPPFDGNLVAPGVSAADAEEAIVDRLRGWFLRYDVSFSTTPPAAPYTMIVVGGTPALAGQPSGIAGVAPIDCTNANAKNVVFVFADELTPIHGSVVALAAAAAHELGHSLGLEHTDNPMDLMFYVDPSSPAWMSYRIFALSFTTTGNFSGYNAGSSEPSTELCGRANPLDDDQILLANLGASTVADRTPPTLSWSSPTGAVSTSFPVAFTAGDDVGVKKIEIYKEENGVGIELIAILRQAPWATTLSAGDGESFTLVAEAVDAAGNRAVAPASFTATAPPATDLGAPVDLASAPDLGIVASGGGCSVAARAPSAAWLLLLILLFAPRRCRL